MKTFSVILIVFVFGTFGWFGIEKQKHNKEYSKIERQKNTDLEISLAENHCAKMELKIQKKQIEILENLKEKQ